LLKDGSKGIDASLNWKTGPGTSIGVPARTVRFLLVWRRVTCKELKLELPIVVLIGVAAKTSIPTGASSFTNLAGCCHVGSVSPKGSARNLSGCEMAGLLRKRHSDGLPGIGFSRTSKR